MLAQTIEMVGFIRVVGYPLYMAARQAPQRGRPRQGGHLLEVGRTSDLTTACKTRTQESVQSCRVVWRPAKDTGYTNLCPVVAHSGEQRDLCVAEPVFGLMECTLPDSPEREGFGLRLRMLHFFVHHLPVHFCVCHRSILSLPSCNGVY